MKTIKKGQDVRVLFQKLGNTWYAFAELGGEIVYSKLGENIDPAVTPMELFEVVEDSSSSRMYSKEMLT